METLKYHYENHKKSIITITGVISIILLASLTFFFINQEYNAENLEPEKNIIAKVEEKNESLENTSTIKVDIKGAVVSPGVYEMTENSRVIDVIEKAGGLEANASTRYINLSKKIEDENIIIINTTDEINQMKISDNKEIICENNCDVCTSSEKIITSKLEETNENSNSSNNNETLNTLVNINEASKETLLTLAGIGESKALNIIEYRNNNGGFKSIEELKNVKGIGESVYEKIKDNITV